MSYILADIAEIEMGQSPPGDSCNSVGSGLPLLNGPTEFGPDHPNPVQWTSNTKRRANKGDLLFCVRGSTTGRMNWADQDYAIGRGIAAIRPRGKQIERLIRAVIENQLPQLLSSATGSTFPNVSRSQLETLAWTNIDEGQWEQTSDFLKTLDDKIALNHKLKATLEGIARALFQSWFVDFDPVKAKLAAVRHGRDPEKAALAAISGKLRIAPGKPRPEKLDEQLPTAEELDAAIAEVEGLTEEQRRKLAEMAAYFPDGFVESELGLIPQGWEVKAASEIFDIAIGKTPPRKESQWFTEGPQGVRWASIRDMGTSGLFIQETSENLTNEAIAKFNVRRIPDKSVLYSFKLTLGRTAITDGEMLSNEAIAHFVTSRDRHPKSCYTYFYLKGFDHAELGSTSSIATAVNSKVIKRMPFLMPATKACEHFEGAAGGILEQIRILQTQSRTLAELRDTLLPKLLSGELSVGEATETVEAATEA